MTYVTGRGFQAHRRLELLSAATPTLSLHLCATRFSLFVVTIERSGARCSHQRRQFESGRESRRNLSKRIHSLAVCEHLRTIDESGRPNSKPAFHIWRRPHRIAKNRPRGIQHRKLRNNVRLRSESSGARESL